MPIHEIWQLQDAPPALDLPLTHPLLRSIVQRRGVSNGEEFRRFTSPERGDLHDPGSIHGMDHACQRIRAAIERKECILIYGDYDADGVTSIVLLRTVLRRLGANVDYVVPHRLFDGYGLKMEVLERVLKDRDVRLVITVDCGITSIDPVKHALDRGIDVIITDHHLPPGTLPDAAAVLNPKQPGCLYPFKDLAGVGVAFKLCCELIRRMESRLSEESLLKIAALGTIAYVAPLTGENRTIARLGLDGLAEPRNPGLRMLVRNLGMFGRPLRSVDVGFKIGPRINATGRLTSADTAIRLFDCATEEEAYPLVTELNRLNDERKAIEKSVRLEAERQIPDPLPQVLVLAGEGWHRGVVGLAAGRIAQSTNRPTLLMAIDGEHAVGSARSAAGIDLHARMERAADLFTHFGGHEFACGFSLPSARIESLRARMKEVFADVDQEVLRKRASVDGTIGLEELTGTFVQEHELLEPFGAGNPQPVFLVEGVRRESERMFAEECWEVRLTDGMASREAVVWKEGAPLLQSLRSGESHDILVQVESTKYSAWGGRMVLVDARPSLR